MKFEQRFDLQILCAFCGHHNHLIVATVSLPDSYAISCSICGGAIGTIGEIRPRREAGSDKLMVAH